MNSTMKTVLPIALIVVMVFAVTFMSQFTRNTPVPIEESDEPAALPLLAGYAETKFELFPSPDSWHNRFHPGYFEVGTDESNNRVAFLIRNPRPSSVFLTALTPGCVACTSARAAAVPPDALRNYVQHVGLASLWSPYPAGDLVGPIAWLQTRQKLSWHNFVFSDASNKFELPGATTAGGDSWGILELGFKMDSVVSPMARTAFFDLYDARGVKLLAEPYKFSVVAGGREAQELNVSDVAMPELTESNSSQAFEILCVSVTRPSLPPPVVAVGNQDPFVTVAKPIKLEADELIALSIAASARAQSAGPPSVVMFQSGYRIQGAIRREANGRALDIGPYEKEVFVSGGPGIVLKTPARLRLHGVVVGAVRLEGTDKIDFGNYDGRFAQKKEVRLWTERKGLELEIVPELCDPSFLKPTLGKPFSEADRTYWTLTVQIPEKEGRRPPWEGFVYLKSKGEKPFNLRIQVSGHGR